MLEPTWFDKLIGRVRCGLYNRSEFPLWNLINGPIQDAVWHSGQVVAFRRASGNPINSKISVFNGKVND